MFENEREDERVSEHAEQNSPVRKSLSKWQLLFGVKELKSIEQVKLLERL